MKPLPGKAMEIHPRNKIDFSAKSDSDEAFWFVWVDFGPSIPTGEISLKFLSI